MRLVITGATGYIGSYLTKSLIDSSNDVFVISRPTSNYTYFDKITMGFDRRKCFEYDGNIDKLLSFFDTVKPDVVLHLATYFIAEHKKQDIKGVIDSNILFFAEVLEASAQSGCKCIINTSTSWQYYGANGVPSCLYAASKKSAEDILAYYIDAFEMKGINIVLFDTYGPNDPRRKIVNILKDRALADDDEEIVMSPGEQVLELVYIDDVVSAYLCAIEQINKYSVCSLNTFYLHSNEQYSLREIVELFEKVADCDLKVRWGGRPYRKREIMLPCPRVNNLPGWKQTVFLEEGLRRILSEHLN